jgi:transcription elongation factor GreA
MASQVMYMTEIGFAKIEASLAKLKVKREDLADQLSDCYTGGDSIDNTEYLVLRDEATYLHNRILELEDILRHAELIQLGEADGKVHMGNTVAIQSYNGPLESYTIVGPVEANPCEGCISNESPLGRALLEHAIGDDISVSAPDGLMHYRIVAVT